MNKIYRVVWNAAINAWVVVSEVAKGKSKSSSLKKISTVIGVLGTITFSANVMGANADTGTVIGNSSVGAIAIGSNDCGDGGNLPNDAGANYYKLTGTHVTNKGAIAGKTTADTSGTGVASDGIALGGNCQYPTFAGRSAIAMGVNAAANTYSIALGRDSFAGGERSLALGYGAQALKDGAVAIGSANVVGNTSQQDGAKANAVGATAIGGAATVDGRTDYSKVGSAATTQSKMFAGAQVVGDGGVAIGIGANTIGKSGVSIGNTASAAGSNSTAIGIGAYAKEDKSLSFGYLASSTSDNAIAMGGNSVASGDASIAIGLNSKAESVNTIALGFLANANGTESVAIGHLAQTTGNSAYALGHGAKAQQGGVSVGGAAISSTFGSAIGYWSLATGSNSVAIGTVSEASVAHAVSIGSWAEASRESSVALGSSSDTTADATEEVSAQFDHIEFGDFAGQAKSGMLVSVGSKDKERQIKNVAAGKIAADSTDAINGSQLFATNTILDNVASTTKNILGGNAQLASNGNLSIFNIGGTGKSTIHDAILASQDDVAKGTNIVDVVKTTDTNGKDTYTVNAKGTTASAGSNLVTVTGTEKDGNITDYAIDLSQEAKNSLEDASKGHNITTAKIGTGTVTGTTNTNIAPGDTVTYTAGNNIAVTQNGKEIQIATSMTPTFNTVNTGELTVTGDTNLQGNAYYTGAITEGNHITNKTYVDNLVTNLVTNSVTDLVNDNPLTFAGNTGTATKKKLGETVTIKGELDEDEDASGANLRVDVKDGQLNLVMSKNLTDINSIVITNGPTINTSGINMGGKTITEVGRGVNGTDAVNVDQLNEVKNTANAGWNIKTDSDGKQSNVKPNDTVSITGDKASGVVVTNNGNDITVGLSDKITVGKGDTAVTIDGEKGNITAGSVTINGTDGTVNGLTNTTWDPNNITSGQAATEDQLLAVAQNAEAAAAAAKNTVSAGDNITVTPTKNGDGSTNYQVATSKDVNFDTVTSGSVTADTVTVGNVVIDKDGINAGGNKVTNVADGSISSTSQDAINGSQLHASNKTIYEYLGGDANYETNTGPTYNVGGGTQHNVGDALDALDQRDNQLDQKITNLGDQLQQSFYSTNKRINDVEKRANAGIAAAMALETAPYVAGKWTYAAAASYHGGENAVGVTLRKTADNGRWSLTGGIAAASQGDPSFRIGISGVID